MAKPDYFHDLKTSVELLKERVNWLEETAEKSGSKHDALKDSAAEYAKEVALVKQQIVEQCKRIEQAISEQTKRIEQQQAEQTKRIEQQQTEQGKRIEEWDRRFWGLLVVFVGAVLSLAAGLIVTLARK